VLFYNVTEGFTDLLKEIPVLWDCYISFRLHLIDDPLLAVM